MSDRAGGAVFVEEDKSRVGVNISGNVDDAASTSAT
jgi:hypothetical protein